SSYLKITISKLYRVNGTTAQKSGVRPDVELPDPPEARTQREADEAFALAPTPIAANKYYMPLAPLPVAAEQAIAAKAMSGNAFFKEAREGARPGKKPARDWSLNLDDQIAAKRVAAASGRMPPQAGQEEKNDCFTVGTPAYERAASEERKKDVLYD